MKSVISFLLIFCLICSILSIPLSYSTLFDNVLTNIVYSLTGVPSGIVYNKFFVVDYNDSSVGISLKVDSTDPLWPNILSLNERLERVHESYLEVHRFFGAKFQYWIEDSFINAYNFDYRNEDGTLETDTTHVNYFIKAYNNALENNAQIPPLGEIWVHDDNPLTVQQINWDNLLYYLRQYEINADKILKLMGE